MDFRKREIKLKKWVEYMIKGDHMFKKEIQVASAEDIAMSQAYTLQALINVLERKGLITREKVFEELEWIEQELNEETLVAHACLN
jgi:hypothetical protein